MTLIAWLSVTLVGLSGGELLINQRVESCVAFRDPIVQSQLECSHLSTQIRIVALVSNQQLGSMP
jgi:hypothetical protein